MWVGPDAGHSQYEDEIFEVQEKRDDIWTDLYYIGTCGNPIDDARDRKAPPGDDFIVLRQCSPLTLDLVRLSEIVTNVCTYILNFSI